MPLNIAHHKSYHPYKRENIERVRRDEEAARAAEEDRARRERLGESDDRLRALRTQRDGGGASGSTRRDDLRETNEAGPSRQPRRDRNRAELAAAAEAGVPLGDLVKRKAWYDDPDLRSHQERQRTQDQSLEAAFKDSALKSTNDPLKAMESFLAQKAKAQKERNEGPATTDDAPAGSLSSYRHYVRDDWGRTQREHSPSGRDFRARPQLFDPGGAVSASAMTSTNEGEMVDARNRIVIKTDPDGPDLLNQDGIASGAIGDTMTNGMSDTTGAIPAANVTQSEAAVDDVPDAPVKSEQVENDETDGAASPLADISTDYVHESVHTPGEASFDTSYDTSASVETPRAPRESMYPVLLGEMIDTVLADESYLFDEAELAVLRAYALLPYDARYLFSRLIQRRDSWLRVEALRASYAAADKEGIDLDLAIAELTQPRSIATSSIVSRFLITHADAGDAGQESLLELLTLDELKNLAKRMHTAKAGTTKASIIKALLTTRSQGTLMGVFGKKPKSDKESTTSGLSLLFTTSGKKASQSMRLANEVTALLGLLVRVDPATRSLIDRVALVFYRGAMLGGTALTTAVLARSRRRNYPQYKVSRSPHIFPSRDNLLAFEEALRVEAEMEELLQWGDNSEATWNKAMALFESIWPIWKRTVQDFNAVHSEVDRKMYHRMRFHAGWPQTRVVSKGAGVLARFKLHTREKEVLEALLAQRYFRRGKRGEWHDRLALIVAQYSLASTAPPSSSSTAKTQSKMAALRIAVAGIEDPDTHLIYHDTLQRRITRLENQLPIPKSQKHDFSYAKLMQCVERTYTGVRLDCMDYGQDERQTQLFPALSRRSASPSKAVAAANTEASPAVGSRFSVRAPMRKIVKVEQPRIASPVKKQDASPVKMQDPPDENAMSPSPVKKEPEVALSSSSLRSRSTSPQKPSRPASSFFMKRDGSSSSGLLLADASTRGPASPSPTPDVDDDDALVSTTTMSRKEKRTSMASVWRGPLDGVGCRVEDVVLQQYQMQGFQGYHDEGGMLKMLFALCLWDVIFDSTDVSDVFETPYQRAPLDLGQDSFAITRGPQLRARLAEISAGAAPDLVKAVDERERPGKTWAVGCRWDAFPTEDLVALATLLPGSMLATIFTMMAEEWEHCSSGMPDLIVWNAETKVVRLCEVKSVNDRLSETQKVWIDVLLRAGVEVEVSLVRDSGGASEQGKRPGLVRKRSSSSSNVSQPPSGRGSPLKKRVS